MKLSQAQTNALAELSIRYRPVSDMDASISTIRALERRGLVRIKSTFAPVIGRTYYPASRRVYSAKLTLEGSRFSK